MATAITGLAALLQWIWAGWSVYTGPGPTLAMRWLLTCAVGAAFVLPWTAAIAGAAVGRWIANSRLRDQFRVTRRGTGYLALVAGGWALAPPLLAVGVSGAGWILVSLAAHRTESGGDGLPGPMAVCTAHALVLLVAAAFAIWALALASGSQPKRRSRASYSWLPRTILQSGVWAVAVLAVVIAGPALVGPALPHLSRPERALDAALLVNPVTAVGAALGMDILRSPRVYGLTRAPEYWYTYPSLAATAGIYLAAAALGMGHLRRQLERE
jgi:hypothetical protein